MATRAEKWAIKLSGDNRKRLYDVQKKRMVELESKATSDLVEIEKEIKETANGVSTILLPYYIIFGKEIYSKMQKHSSESLLNEVEILQEKWIKRGLDWQILDSIKVLYLEKYQKGSFFLMDSSPLDGNYRLA